MAKKNKVLNPVQIRKIFILDTSVILHDHQAVNQFEEHDVAIPISVLEELDSFKKGNDTINFEARQFIRFVDKLSEGNSLNQWIQLSPETPSCFTVVMQESGTEEQNAVKIFGDRKADHLILNAALFIKQEYSDRPVILVTKDVNLRLKARSLNLQAEDYETGKIQNLEGLYRGITQLDLEESEMIDKIHQMESVHYSEVMKSSPYNNHYFIIKNHRSSTLAYFNPETKNLERVEKRHAYGIKPRNAEQYEPILNHLIWIRNVVSDKSSPPLGYKQHQNYLEYSAWKITMHRFKVWESFFDKSDEFRRQVQHSTEPPCPVVPDENKRNKHKDACSNDR